MRCLQPAEQGGCEMRRLLGRLLGGDNPEESRFVERASKASDTVRGARGGTEEYYRLLGQLQTLSLIHI